MADVRRLFPNQQLDLEQILQEARNRWLRPAEICEILRNHQKFYLTPDPPVRPPAGSLFLFDRKSLRYFRKDGHRWRKKKDGKTVREAHEKLKTGSVDVLHCYYAHGEDNESFQRRSYWMLDGHLEHIVLVHYREVKEGYKAGISRLLGSETARNTVKPPVNSAPSSNATSVNVAQIPNGSSPNASRWTGQTLSSEYDDGDSGDDPGISSYRRPIYVSSPPNSSLCVHEASGFSELLRTPLNPDSAGANFCHGTSSSLWPQINSSSGNVNSLFDKNVYFGQYNGAEPVTCKLVDTHLDNNRAAQDMLACGIRLMPDKDVQQVSGASQGTIEVPRERDFNDLHPKFQSQSDSQRAMVSDTRIEDNYAEGDRSRDESVELKNLDSFGRWMNKEIVGDCDDSLMASDSGNYWNTLDSQNDDKEVSSLSRQMQLDVDSLGPSLSQEQLFTICDFSPDWAYTGVETKVLITGKFLGNTKHSTATKWCCMFGEIEVPAEVLSDNVVRCHTPSHAPGRVPFYITCSNRLACSEVREFEYREKPPQDAFSLAAKTAPEDELRFQIRLAKFLYLDPERKWLNCSNEDCDKCKLEKCMSAINIVKEDDLQGMDAASVVVEVNKQNPSDVLIQYLLKHRLREWLLCRTHEGGKGPNVWDEGGLGVIHMAAALGYGWAMGPIITAGVGPNFRDVHGRTGLHWASFFGREEAVLMLIRLGADPGAVDDPKSGFPGGETAADLASRRGHKGIAGYLAEAQLTNHLNLLTLNQDLVNNSAENAETSASEPPGKFSTLSDGKIDENTSLKGSLVAVRKSARAAALIQAAFRARSFCHRQLNNNSNAMSEVSLDLVALGSLDKVHKMGHYSDYLHSAAVKIQKKYRGWKGRKEFLKIRNRLVKLQAHVRGHQIRKQYRKVVWSVSIVEKAILRWRRKGSGLRGFRAEKDSRITLHEKEKVDDYDYLRIGQKQKFDGVENALSRVKSMARHPEARDQYMRLVTRTENLKIHDKGGSPSH